MEILKSNIIGSSDRNLVILHGLYGSSDSWMRIAKDLSDFFTVHMPDQRNHGESFWSDKHNYSAMSEDLYLYLKSENIKSVDIIGHSMGGKVAMEFAVKYPQMINKMVIADISPRSHKALLDYDKTSNFHLNLLSLMKSINLEEFSEYRELSKLLLPYGETVKNVIIKNIAKVDGKFSWKINVNSLLNNLPEIMEGLDPDDFIDNKVKVETLFLQAENSNYITSSDKKLIDFIFSDYSIQVIPDAGHWLHYDNPSGTLAAIKIFLL